MDGNQPALDGADAAAVCFRQSAKSGSADEQIASMPYLVGYAEKQEIEQLTALLDSASPEVQRAAQYTLWALQVNGTEMPSYIAF